MAGDERGGCKVKNNEDARSAAYRLVGLFCAEPWYIQVGIGVVPRGTGPAIYLYVTDIKCAAQRNVPAMIDEIPVIVRKTGRPKAKAT